MDNINRAVQAGSFINSVFTSVLPSAVIPAGANGYAATVADVNNDGCPDIITISTSGTYFSTQVYTANKTASCQRGYTSSPRFIETGYQQVGVAVGKLYSTTVAGKLDLAALTTNWMQHLTTYQNTGTTVPFSSYASTFSTQGPFFYAAPPAYDATSHGSPVIGDFNNDGIPDFIVKTGGSATIYMGSAGGNFTPLTTEVSTGDVSALSQAPHPIALADVNGDGNLDVIAGNYNSASFGSVSVTLGLGNGLFGSQQLFGADVSTCTSNSGVFSVGVADFNQDGIPDLVVGNQCNNAARIQIYSGLGDGTFNTTPYVITPTAGNYVADMVVMDINGDGIPDIVALLNTNRIQIFLGVGNGTVTAKTITAAGLPSGNAVGTLAVGDIDNDGTLDFVMTNYNGGTTWSMLRGSTGSASGFTGAPVTFSGAAVASTFNWVSLGLVDWNQDGWLDVLGFKTNGGMQFFNATGAAFGSGSFTVSEPWLVGNPGSNMIVNPAILDLNGDGLPDLLTTGQSNNATGAVGVVYNYSTGATTH